MKIFLVWSGKESFEIAKALNDWLPRLIQAVKPFFSHEIEKGAKWASEIDTVLEGTHFGLVCLTPNNLDNTWIHYEVGALSKTKEARIWTYLSRLKSTDVPQPLGKFQHTLANKSDTLRLVKTINKRLSEVGTEPLAEQILDDNFEIFWPKLEEKLKAATKTATETVANEAPKRDQDAKLDEILELLRNQQRRAPLVPENVRKIQNVRYKEVNFVVPTEVEENEIVAQAYADLFRSVPAETTRETNDEGILVRITFQKPTPRTTIVETFDKAANISGWRPSSWTAIHWE